ncbi:MAG: iron chelate uptake ABC transporter family permease subunit [Acidimicrobiia bacterium]|nr:iron chelate uptake ABC transporter family permease subunit [Acidimicrobiia bacterium]
MGAALVEAPPPAGDARLGAARAQVARGRAANRARTVSVSLVLASLIAIVFCASISVGDFPIPVQDVVPAVFGFGGADSHFIVHTLRLPRALVGLLVGGSFGLSGAIFQNLARNPLASPDIIGVTAGATTAAVFAIVILGAGYTVVSLSAFVGALASAVAVYVLAYKRGVSSYRIVLVGIGVGAVMLAITQYLLTRAEIFDAQRAMVWLTGSLNGRGWEHVRPLLLAGAVLVPLVLLLARPLRALQLGDETASGLGTRVDGAKAALLLVGVGLAAVATAAAGPVVFVAFVSAPIARRLTRAPGLALVPAALVGALLLLAADLLARRALAPTELPVGIVTGILGAPYLLWLLARANRVGRGG